MARVARAAGLVMALFVVSRALGLLREMVISHQFGTSGTLDAYLAELTAEAPLVETVIEGELREPALHPTHIDHQWLTPGVLARSRKTPRSNRVSTDAASGDGPSTPFHQAHAGNAGTSASSPYHPQSRHTSPGCRAAVRHPTLILAVM